MTGDELAKRREALFQRYLDGEIDKAAYDRMLAELDRAAEREATPSEAPQEPDQPDAPDRFGQQPTIYQESPAAPQAPSAPQPGPPPLPPLPPRQQVPPADQSGPPSGQQLPPAALKPGDELGPFRLVEVIGRGGMGEVWKAHDPTAERFVVIKVVPPDVQRADEEMARVKDAFSRIHALHHQHICPIYLLDEDDRCGYFVVMKYIDGQTLSSHRASIVAKQGSFPLEEVARVLGPVASALDYAHSRKVVHRDIKPQNILVSGGDEGAQVIDFGLAAEIHASISRVSRVRMDTSGTYPYMAPEQWRGEYQDARADQYALAVVAYELLSGRLPFDTPDTETLRLAVLNDPPRTLADQPAHVNRALGRALAKRRDERFANCARFVEALANPAVSERSEEGVKLEVVETPQVVPPRLPPRTAPQPPASPPGVPYGRAPAMPPRAGYYEPAAVRRQRAAEKFGIVKRLLLLVFNLGCFAAVLLAIPLLHRDLFDLDLQHDWPELGAPAAAVLGMGITWLAAGLVVAMATTLVALVAVPGFGLGDALGWFLMIAATFAITGGAGGYVEATDWDSHCEYVGLVGVPVMALLSLLMTALQLAEVSRAARGAPGCGCGCAILGIMLLCLAATVAVAVVVDLMDEAERTTVYEPPVANDEFYEDYDPYFDGNEEEKKK